MIKYGEIELSDWHKSDRWIIRESFDYVDDTYIKIFIDEEGYDGCRIIFQGYLFHLEESFKKYVNGKQTIFGIISDKNYEHVKNMVDVFLLKMDKLKTFL